MTKEQKILTLYTILASTLNLLEELDENINTTRITGGGELGVEWDNAIGRYTVGEVSE